jgi:hypothetical protein
MSSVSQLGSRLLQDLRSRPLLPYQDETVRGITQDVETLRRELTERVESRGDAGAEFPALTLVQEGSVRRLKRALLVYHASRCERIEALRWSTGTVLPAAVRETLANSEVDYFRDYCSAYSQYADAVEIDLMAVSRRPRRRRLARRRRRHGAPSGLLTPIACSAPLTPFHAPRPCAESQAAEIRPHTRARPVGLRRRADEQRAPLRARGRNALHVARRLRAPRQARAADPSRLGLEVREKIY